ncbi:glycosyl hydrolase family 8 [Clostridium cylindrosporum]|uniref:Putative lipoprotein YdaJ n=1 Tax=Clostridium cylindrosporum DSM 605 TaxID=1121307 RepID=A0A0J8DA63_CLOCY|nr:glycosyl hydrolase family 8 [Clostridium cylindrosporum]KMT21193.1 putative lipoprotein YdaJ [Clostridium cylindrosporum DSM 605]
MKKLYSLISVFLVFLMITAYIVYPYVKPLKLNIVLKNYKETSYSSHVRKFIETKLSREDGAIYTNYLNKKNMGDETKGHFILSESQGLLMDYALMINDEKMFDKAYKVVKDYMILDNGLVSWRISKKNDKSSTSALIDELRIAKALVKAYIKFDRFKYKVDAIKISKSILKNSTYNNMVSDFNDGVNRSKLLTLCYIDLEAFKLLGSIDEQWNEIYIKGKDILNKGYVSSDIPLFRKNYDLLNRKYSSESDNELLYSLMVWENLMYTGVSPKPINDWMKKQLKKYGCLYTKYSIDRNTPVDYIESTAIYAVSYRIASKGSDKELIEKLNKSLMKYHIDKGELKDGFGMEKSKEAYSFDNLESMISLLKEKNN